MRKFCHETVEMTKEEIGEKEEQCGWLVKSLIAEFCMKIAIKSHISISINVG